MNLLHLYPTVPETRRNLSAGERPAAFPRGTNSPIIESTFPVTRGDRVSQYPSQRVFEILPRGLVEFVSVSKKKEGWLN